MTFINDPESHRPHGPRLGTAYELDLKPNPTDFYQPPSSEQRKLADTLPHEAETLEQFNVTLDDYQAWCELNWRQPHGTAASMGHLVAKLIEENHELKEEIYESSKRSAEDGLVSELGDILWCVTAISSDLRINVKHGLMMLMDRYGHGTRNFEGGSLPAWVKEAQTLTFDDRLSAKQLDDLINNGYEPLESSDLLIDEPGEITDVDIEDTVRSLEFNSRFLISLARMNYEPDIYQSGAVQRGEEIEHLVARIYLDVAFLAKHAAASSLTEVIRANILKLSDRVSQNTIS